MIKKYPILWKALGGNTESRWGERKRQKRSTIAAVKADFKDKHRSEIETVEKVFPDRR